MGLLCRRGISATFNVALAVRTSVLLKPYCGGKVAVQMDGSQIREASFPKLDFGSDLTLIAAILTHFRVHGLCVTIRSGAPPRSGLGGSAAMVVALITALSRVLTELRDEPRLRRTQLVRLAYNIEDALFDNCGMQDQAAAVYGGANLWTWRFDHDLNFIRRRVQCKLQTLEQHTAVAYTGILHPSSRKGSAFLKRFREDPQPWLIEEISNKAKQLVAGIETGDYESAAESLRAETELRRSLLPEALSETGQRLLDVSSRFGCGAKPAGRGGTVWAIGAVAAVRLLKVEWAKLLGRGPGQLLQHSFTVRGVESQTHYPENGG